MPRGAILFTWGSPVRGREQNGLEALRDTVGHFNDLAQEGRVERVRVYFNRTGDTTVLSGIIAVEGDLDELRRIQAEDTYQRNLERAFLIVDHLNVMTCIGGAYEDIEEPLNRYTAAMASFGLT